ncbi:hypothetical protein J6590_065562, partial [Homalodisca vitripennis]
GRPKEKKKKKEERLTLGVHPTNYTNGARSGPQNPSRNQRLRLVAAGAQNGQELTPHICQALQ